MGHAHLKSVGDIQTVHLSTKLAGSTLYLKGVLVYSQQNRTRRQDCVKEPGLLLSLAKRHLSGCYGCKVPTSVATTVLY